MLIVLIVEPVRSFPSGATKLMNAGTLVLKGAHLTVTALSDIYEGLDRESCPPKAVTVSGISSQTSTNFLTRFFRNRHKSGGGNIEHLEYDNNDGIAVITFKEADSKFSYQEIILVLDWNMLW